MTRPKSDEESVIEQFSAPSIFPIRINRPMGSAGTLYSLPYREGILRRNMSKGLQGEEEYPGKDSKTSVVPDKKPQRS